MLFRSTIHVAAALAGLALATHAIAGQSNAHHRHHQYLGRHGVSQYVDAPIGTTDYSSCPIVRRGVQTAQGLRWAYVRTCGN